MINVSIRKKVKTEFFLNPWFWSAAKQLKAWTAKK